MALKEEKLVAPAMMADSINMPNIPSASAAMPIASKEMAKMKAKGVIASKKFKGRAAALVAAKEAAKGKGKGKKGGKG